MAALLFIGRGRCYFPDCRVMICALVGDRYFFDCVRAHIEAAEPNGPRWNDRSSDEDRRRPENLLWLCVKHHSAIDQDEAVYTVDVLKAWKTRREGEEPSLGAMATITEGTLREIVEGAFSRLATQLEALQFPGHEVAQMLLAASERFPDRAVAELLVRAGEMMPDEDVAMLLFDDGRRLPDPDDVSYLGRAAERFPDESTATLPWQAAEKFPSGEYLAELDMRINALNHVASSFAAIGVGNDRTSSPAPQAFTALENPWAWFAGAAITVAIAVVGGLVAYLILSR